MQCSQPLEPAVLGTVPTPVIHFGKHTVHNAFPGFSVLKHFQILWKQIYKYKSILCWFFGYSNPPPPQKSHCPPFFWCTVLTPPKKKKKREGGGGRRKARTPFVVYWSFLKWNHFQKHTEKIFSHKYNSKPLTGTPGIGHLDFCNYQFILQPLFEWCRTCASTI